MDTEIAIAETFDDGETIIVLILGPPSSTGLVKCRRPDGKTIVRNVTKLSNLNSAAATLLER